jgi:hypothetical protein
LTPQAIRSIASAALGLLVLAWTLRTLGVTPWTALRAAGVLALAILPMGLLLTRGLARAGLFRGERVVLAAVVGYPLSATAYYVFSAASIEFLFLPSMAALGWFAVRRPREAMEPPFDPAARPPASLALLVPLLLLELTRFGRAFLATEAGLAYRHSVDHSLHLSFYFELLRGVPAQQIPAAAGIPFPTYHFFAFMPGLLLAKSAALPVSVVYHAIVPLMKLGLLMGAVYLGVRVRSGDGRTAAAALPALLLLAHVLDARLNERFVVGPWPHYDFLRNEAEGGGLVVWAAVFCLLLIAERARAHGGSASSRCLLLASLLAGLSYGFKAQLFLLFGGAYVLVLLRSLRRERWREPLLQLTVLGAAFLFAFWLSRRPGSLASPQWTPGLFAELYIYPNLRRDAWALSQSLLALFEALPTHSGALLAVVFAIWRIVLFSPLVAGYLAGALRRVQALGPADLLACLSFLLAVPMAYGFSVVSFYEAASPFEFRQAAHGLAFLAAAIDVLVLHSLIARRRADAGSVTYALVLIACLAAAPLVAGERPYVPARAGIVLSPDESCALLFLRERTHPAAVVAGARAPSDPGAGRAPRLNHHAVIAGFAGRRSLLEFYERQVDRERNRERDLRRLFTTPDARVGEALLDAYAVDYLLESDARPLQFATEKLERVYERGSFRVQRVRRAGAAPLLPADQLPPPFRAGDDLRCAAQP